MSTPGAITTSATLPIAEPTSGPADTSSAAGGMPGSLGEFLQVHKQVSVVDSTQPISFDAVGMQSYTNAVYLAAGVFSGTICCCCHCCYCYTFLHSEFCFNKMYSSAIFIVLYVVIIFTLLFII